MLTVEKEVKTLSQKKIHSDVPDLIRGVVEAFLDLFSRMGRGSAF